MDVEANASVSLKGLSREEAACLLRSAPQMPCARQGHIGSSQSLELTATTNPALRNGAAKPAQLRLTRPSPAFWRVTIDNPPINVMGPEIVREFQQLMNAIEADE